MQRELQRAQSKLGQLDPAPYFTSYSVYDQEGTVVVGGLGSLLNSTQFHRRTGEVTMRVGSAALDNTHQESRPSGMSSGLIPLQDDPDAAARVLVATYLRGIPPGGADLPERQDGGGGPHPGGRHFG